MAAAASNDKTGGTDGEPVNRRGRRARQGASSGAGLGAGNVATRRARPAQRSEPGERQVRLALDAGDREHAHAGGPLGGPRTQRALADPASPLTTRTPLHCSRAATKLRIRAHRLRAPLAWRLSNAHAIHRNQSDPRRTPQARLGTAPGIPVASRPGARKTCGRGPRCARSHPSPPPRGTRAPAPRGLSGLRSAIAVAGPGRPRQRVGDGPLPRCGVVQARFSGSGLDGGRRELRVAVGRGSMSGARARERGALHRGPAPLGRHRPWTWRAWRGESLVVPIGQPWSRGLLWPGLRPFRVPDSSTAPTGTRGSSARCCSHGRALGRRERSGSATWRCTSPAIATTWRSTSEAARCSATGPPTVPSSDARLPLRPAFIRRYI